MDLSEWGIYHYNLWRLALCDSKFFKVQSITKLRLSLWHNPFFAWKWTWLHISWDILSSQLNRDLVFCEEVENFVIILVYSDCNCLHKLQTIILSASILELMFKLILQKVPRIIESMWVVIFCFKGALVLLILVSVIISRRAFLWISYHFNTVFP